MSTPSPGRRGCDPRGAPGSVAFKPYPGTVLFLALAFFLCACSPHNERNQGQAPAIHAERWPQAEEAFRHDRLWLGGDGAYSVPLGQGRVLWLFGDSFIGDGTSRDRRRAAIVRNTVAIQKGLDPASASVRFSWKTRDGKPEAFFPGRGETWYWPGSGILVQGRLLVFLMEIAPVRGGLGFEAKGWAAALVSNPGDDPDAWRVTSPGVPSNPFRVIVGSACCAIEGDSLYAFGSEEKTHGAYLVRWRLADAARGDLKSPEWWAGKDGWVAQGKISRRPEPLFGDAQMEFTVHREPALGRYVEVQTGGFTNHCLALRWSLSLTGPWSGKRDFFCPGGTEGLLVYAGKAHPGLAGGDLICTMAMNSLDAEKLLGDNSLYYPVFVKGTYLKPGE